ncbi:hypothetical protein FA13DRAFT_1757767 [Coprinellus micaceus]|uniref:N-acetyltransferase domain-containing protein n=1 Tax=Coprinellus micaceus TaxID=71717 RepID=A0A4Y7SFA6_COPMI|nr:hypothetical protein FA13DRAFT_1757767 [Coprinellus micaceus]
MSPTEPQHDSNFCFAVPSVLENDRVRVTPFIPPIHLSTYFAASERHPEVYKYLPWGPFSSQEDLGHLVDKKFSKDPGYILFAVFDKADPAPDESKSLGVIAGVIAYGGLPVLVEIGAVIVLPQVQRKDLASNAVGLLLGYALKLPTHPCFRGLRLAQRLGFQMEEILRWDRVLPAWKETDVGNGKGEREGDPRAGWLGRDTVMLSLCWDDWENGGRDKVALLMQRGNNSPGVYAKPGIRRA